MAQAKSYDRWMSEYSGFMASRRNYDVGQGIGADGRRRSGVLEASWRAGGASSAELLALAAFAQDRALQIVEASTIEEFGAEGNAPPGAIIHFQGNDPDAVAASVHAREAEEAGRKQRPGHVLSQHGD